MDTSLIDPLRPQTREESRCRGMLLIARALCAVAALVVAMACRPWVALPALVLLAGAVVGAEYAYRWALNRERQRRKRRVEAAEREKQFRAIRQAQRAAAQKYFDEQSLVLGRTGVNLAEPPA
jgi:Flp pilus assembly protein TadB